MLLGLHSLVQAVPPRPIPHEASREVIHNHDLVVLDHILLVAGIELLGDQGLDRQLLPASVHPPEAPERLGLLGQSIPPLVGKLDLLPLGTDPVVLARAQIPHDLGGLAEGLHLLRVGGLARDDQGGHSLVDQDRVRLVHDGRVESPLHHGPGRRTTSGDRVQQD